jgi:Polysaccharide deacetylase
MSRTACLGYHEVTDNAFDSGFQRPLAMRYKHTTAAFRAHLELIAASPRVPELVTNIDLGGRSTHLLLTFDDGGKSALHVSDELCKRGWRAHFLITTALIGQRTFLDKHGIRLLRQAGHIVGSHSHTHPDIFNDQSRADMMWQWQTSCDILSQLLGEACTVASVPGGDISPMVLNSAHESNIRYLFTSEPWLKPRRVGDCWIVGRVAVKTDTPAARVRAYSSLRGWRRALLERRASVAARRLLAPLYRVYVRQRTAALSETNE